MGMARLALALALSAATPGFAQGSAANRADFGPDRGNGLLANITRQHLVSIGAQGIAVDGRRRVLVMNQWREPGSTNFDCAVTRHIAHARLLDMAYTGPEGLEATRRIAMDLGGSDYDDCASIDIDDDRRAVIAGWAASATSTTGFVVRLSENGAYDTAFSGDGKVAIEDLAGLGGVRSQLRHAIATGDAILACGWVERGASRNMLVVRLTAAGQLDTTFRGTGRLEVDFDVDGDRDDACSRLLVLPNGNIVAAGIVTGSSGERAYGIAQVTATGAYVGAFGTQGRRVIDDGSVLAATPELSDLAWDAARGRLLVGCTLVVAGTPYGCLIAVRGNDGSLDLGFSADGRMGFRFSDYGSVLGSPLRAGGGTRVRRVFVRDDGGLYVLGTHVNVASDAVANGATDAASLRLTAAGNVATSGADVHGNDGVRFHVFREVDQGVAEVPGRVTSEDVVDATWYQGGPLLLVERPRYPAGVFDHDGDGNLDEVGPIVPVALAIRGEHLFDADFDFDGLDRSDEPQPIITPPAGLGRYCSARHPTDGSVYGIVAGGPTADPCQSLLAGNPDLVVERAGLFATAGVNSVIGTCADDFTVLRTGTGMAPINSALAAAAGQRRCIFTVTPAEMPIFSRPYSGAHLSGASNWTQSFNHDAYRIPIDVSEFGQPPGAYDACSVDNRGRQRSAGNPASGQCAPFDGVDEPAVDIPVLSPRLVRNVAPGLVVMAVPRHVPLFAPAGMDPYQREVFVRHQVGSGTYREVFTSYYAHMQDTAVRRGDFINTGVTLGRVGTTGSSSGDHLHLSVHRHRNLSYRASWEFTFDGGAHDRDGSVSAFDPWGWDAPEGSDPWAWRFRVHPGGDTRRNDSGSFSTRLWIPGEEPPLP